MDGWTIYHLVKHRQKYEKSKKSRQTTSLHSLCTNIGYTKTFYQINGYAFLPRDATQSAVMRLRAICPSVCPSVTFRYRDHVGWNSSKIISRPNSLTPMRSLTPTWAIWCTGTPPKLGLNRGGVRST